MANDEGHQEPDGRAEAKEKVAEEMIDPAHVRHCIDYLRQSLMCHGDATVEVKPVGVNGVRGFGIEHQCRDWERLRGWVESMQPK